MRRTTSLTAAGLLGLALLGGAPPTTAAGETCRGEAATIVGSGSAVTGTDGRDVIVTNGSRQVTALGGDDLVCVTGPPFEDGYVPVLLDAGTGDDVVDGTATADWVVEGALGPGSDTFAGGPGDERVRAGASTADFTGHLDTETDVLVGGSGDDDVTSGQPGQANGDRVDLGDGDDRLSTLGTPMAGAHVAAGPGRDSVVLSLLGGENRIDNVTERLTLAGSAPVPLEQVETFYLRKPDAATAEVTFVGGAASEHLEVWGTQLYGRVVADMGGGADSVALQRVSRGGSRIEGGAGRDELTALSTGRPVSWDLRGGTLAVGNAWSFPATGFEDALLMAPRVDLRGTGGDNQLAFVSCDGRLAGRGGDDTLVLTGDAIFEEYPACAERTRMVGGAGDDTFRSRAGARDRMVGGPGNDRFDARGGNDELVGGAGRDRAILGNGDDTFLGGPGRDRVDGERGRDRCRAEQVVGCERR